MEPSRPAATPLKTGAGTTVAGGGEPPYDGNMEHRITNLEARWDSIFPTLATKADLADGLHQNSMAISALRSEMQQSFAAVHSEMQQSFAAVRSEMQQSFATVHSEMQQSFADVRSEGEQSSADLRSEMHQSFADVHIEIQQIRTGMQKLSADIKTWTLATVLTIIGTMLAALIGISQVTKVTPPAPIVITLPAAE
jgi:hypothetical protein